MHAICTMIIWCNKYICQPIYADCTKSQASETEFPNLFGFAEWREGGGNGPPHLVGKHAYVHLSNQQVCLPLTQMECTCTWCLLLTQLGMHTHSRPPLLRPGSKRLKWAGAWRLGTLAREFNI